MTLSSSRTRATAMLLCRWVLSHLNQGPRFIWAILQRLFYRWGSKGRRWRFSLPIDEEKKIGGSPQNRSCLPLNEAPRRYHVFDDDKLSTDTSSAKEGLLIEPNLSYIILNDSETISLDNVACSALPFPGGSIRDASKSSENLEKSRRAHDQHVAGPPGLSRTPSRGSAYTNSSRGSSENHTNFKTEGAHGTTIDTHLGADLSEKARAISAARKPTWTDNGLLSETTIPYPGDASVQRVIESPTSWSLSMAHISPAIPVATQRYRDRPTM